ncbi:MAG: HD domain-containing protein [Phycisphaerae bacterium]|nr:HD domain-containing protein [Phycisphaerae bacterium]
MAHLFVKDIKPGLQINDIYMVSQPVLRNTTRGDLYIAMYLSDKTGKLNARMWQATEALYNQIPAEGFLQIRGKSELYQGSLQLVINDLVVVRSDQVNLAEYMPRTDKDTAKLFAELKEMLKAIKNPGLSALIREFLDDAELMKRFCTAPAAMQMHHCFLGGLLEHTHSMMQVAMRILPLYPKVQADLVLAAIFLHDIAKTAEMSYEVAFSYTDRGQLLGHILLGSMWIQDKARAAQAKGAKIDSDVLDSLLHIILAHHGEYEFGSPKLPATAEAFMVNYIDNLDAKMNQVATLIDTDATEGNWTGYQKSLETRLYRKRPTL